MEAVIDCAGLHSRRELHSALARALSFPAHYGNNLDALYDCLSDIRENTRLVLKNWEHTLPFSRGFRLVLEEAENNNPHLFVCFE